MNVKELFTDDDAVSPVIGVILMVAITVILAAVIGAFVLNIGGSQESAPQVTWEWSDDSGSIDLKHGGGDKVTNPTQLSISDSNNGEESDIFTSGPFDGTITAGDEKTVVSGVSSSGTVELIWESSDGSDTQILATHDYDFS